MIKIENGFLMDTKKGKIIDLPKIRREELKKMKLDINLVFQKKVEEARDEMKRKIKIARDDFNETSLRLEKELRKRSKDD